MSPAPLLAVKTIDAEYAGRIAAAARSTQERRDASMVHVPFVLCGVHLRIMTLDDYLTLIVTGNAHLAAVEPPAGDTEQIAFWTIHSAQLIWFLSPSFVPDARRRDAFLKKVGQFPAGEVESGVTEYLREIFADAPRGPVASPEDAPPADPIGVSFAAHWIARIARRFPWSRAEIRALPLPELFQYLRIIAAEKRIESGEQPIALDDEVDRLWAEKNEKITALLKPVPAV